MKRFRLGFYILLMLAALNMAAAADPPPEPHQTFQPIIIQARSAHPEPMVELRGLWVNRYDWTSWGRAADPAKIDEIVQNAAYAGFNVIFFQVRGAADAYYASELEPWAWRVSGGDLGQAPDPYWDPLAYFVEKAHAAGLQLHAYLNVYPLTDGGIFCDRIPDETVSPTPLYHQLLSEYGATAGQLNGAIWQENGTLLCSSYRYASPASAFAADHIIAVVKDLATRYDIDGIHLDYIRYPDPKTSCDPVSLCQFSGQGETCASPPACVIDDAYKDWQREQVNALLQRSYDEIISLADDTWLSAAVWPLHTQSPEMNLPGQPISGYHTYYQDSKGWLAGGYIDAIAPMIYPSSFHCPDDSYWSRAVWKTLVTDFQADSHGRAIIPGIGSGYCTFDEIATRIDMAREIGAAGHALFSYRGLLQNGYFDDLRRGPYFTPAVVPELLWRSGRPASQTPPVRAERHSGDIP
ncbi:MAG TPA: family 10 glycosylhydrolase [Caldilineae bacterium]|nr:family 10 glycosylhydrolase [Caldilineae bacterium]